MKTHVTGQAAGTATPTPEAAHTAALTAYRQTLLGLILNNPLFSDAEQLRANHNAHACDNPNTLAKWVRNTTREADRRRQNPPATYATASQRETIVRLLNHPKVTRQQKTGTLLTINRLTKEAAAELIQKLELLTGAQAPGQQLSLPTLTRYAPKPAPQAERPRHRLPQLPALGTIPNGIQPRRAFAATVRLHRKPNLPSSYDRWRVAQPGEAFHLCYHLN